MTTTKPQVDLGREYICLAMEAVAQADAGIPYSITEFTNRLTEYLPVKIRYRLDWPTKPHDRWNWIESNADHVVKSAQGSRATFGPYTLRRKRAQVIIGWAEVDTVRVDMDNPFDTTVEPLKTWTREDAQALADVCADYADDSDVQEAQAAAMAGDRAAQAYVTQFVSDNEWAPRESTSEYIGGALGANERIVNIRVYTNGWITHAVQSGISEMIDHDAYRRTMFKIKFDLGISNRPAHVKRENGRGGYWVIHPDIFAKYGIQHIQEVIRAAYALNDYKVLFTIQWVEADWLDEDLIR